MHLMAWQLLGKLIGIVESVKILDTELLKTSQASQFIGSVILAELLLLSEPLFISHKIEITTSTSWDPSNTVYVWKALYILAEVTRTTWSHTVVMCEYVN